MSGPSSVACVCGHASEHHDKRRSVYAGLMADYKVVWACGCTGCGCPRFVQAANPPAKDANMGTTKTAGQELDEIMRDMDAAYAACRAVKGQFDSPEYKALDAVYARLRALTAEIKQGADPWAPPPAHPRSCRCDNCWSDAMTEQESQRW